MTTSIKLALPLFVLVAACALVGADGPMTQAELEVMVRELEAKAPKNPDYVYPIKVTLSDNDVLNARAHLAKPEKEGEKPRACVTVFQKFVRFIDNDRRLIRAVVAHEVSHLSRGHVSKGFRPGDLSLIHTRQQEIDADVCAAALLQGTGYSKGDMVDFLNFAETKLRGKDSWVEQNLSDHPMFQERIAAISDNPNVARSLASFDYGLMFMENRSFSAAYDSFQRSIEKQPDFAQAYVNAAQAKLQLYYENVLPESVRNGWFLAEFGPALVDRPQARGGANLQAAIIAYRSAVTALDLARAKDKDNPRLAELTALSQVLDPEGEPKNLQAGTDALRSMYARAVGTDDKLRLGNNAALGLQRSGRLNDAVRLLVDAEASTQVADQMVVNLTVARNLGSFDPTSVDKKNSGLVATVLSTYLRNTAAGDPAYDKVKTAYSKVCQKHGLKEEEIKPSAATFCQVSGLTYKGQEVALTSPPAAMIAAFGSPMKTFDYDELFPDMKEMVWDSSDLTAIVDKETVLRVTSYAEGAELVLRSKAVGGADVHVKVGGRLGDLEAALGGQTGVSVPLLRAGRIEKWTYYVGLNFGVLVEEDKLVGVTATPVSTD